MKINLYDGFKKAFKKRIAPNPKLVTITQKKIDLFKSNSKDPLLKNHGLSGAKKGLRAFSITGDIRIVYLPVSDSEVIFIDIGSHNQVY